MAVERTFPKHGDGDQRKLSYAFRHQVHEFGPAMVPKVASLKYTFASRIGPCGRLASPRSLPVPYVRQPQKLANFVYGNRADLGNEKGPEGPCPITLSQVSREELARIGSGPSITRPIF